MSLSVDKDDEELTFTIVFRYYFLCDFYYLVYESPGRDSLTRLASPKEHRKKSEETSSS